MEEKNTNHSKNNNRNDNNRLVDRNHNCQSIRSQRVGGLILAAGLSTRMGQSKPLTKFLDNNLIDQTIKTMYDAGIDHIHVVTGFEQERVEAYLQANDLFNRIHTIWNPNYGNGSILTSIKTGLPRLKEFDYVFIQLVDLPCILPETYQKLWETMLASGKKAVIPTVDGRRGHPVLIDMSLLPEILSYENAAGGGGLRVFWKLLGDEFLEVPVTDCGSVMDTDTKEQLREAERYLIQRRNAENTEHKVDVSLR